jgi:hypothetical protein
LSRQFHLLVDEQLGITNDVDAQEMRDLARKICLASGDVIFSGTDRLLPNDHGNFLGVGRAETMAQVLVTAPTMILVQAEELALIALCSASAGSDDAASATHNEAKAKT